MQTKSSSSSLRLLVLFLTIVRTILHISTRMVYPFMLVFTRGMGVELQDISHAIAMRASTGVLSPVLSPLSDRYGRKFGMLMGLVLFTLGAGALVFWPSFTTFFISQSLCYLGGYLFVSTVHAYLGDLVPYQQRGRVIAINEMGWSLSFIVGVPLMGLLIARFGWAAPYPLLMSLGVAATMAVLWLLPASHGAANPKGGSIWSHLRNILQSRSALVGLLMGLTFAMGNEIIGMVYGVWMELTFGLKIAALGAATAAFGLADLGGEMLTAWLVDRLGKERAIAMGLISNAALVAILPWLAGLGVGGAIAGLCFFFMTYEITVVSSLPLMSEVLPQERATMMGINIAANSLGRALGALIAPLIFAFGFRVSTLATVAFNLLALLALSRIRLQHPTSPEPAATLDG